MEKGLGGVGFRGKNQCEKEEFREPICGDYLRNWCPKKTKNNGHSKSGKGTQMTRPAVCGKGIGGHGERTRQE